MLTLDTSAIYALLDRSDPDHDRVARALDADTGPYVVPAGILSEIAYLVETRFGRATFDSVLADIESGAYTLHCGEDDLPRVRALTARYDDLDLGYADAAVIACAERNAGRVLTLDARHFGVVAREGSITVVPETDGLS